MAWSRSQRAPQSNWQYQSIPTSHPNRAKEVLPEKDVTENAAPPEPPPNWWPLGITASLHHLLLVQRRCHRRRLSSQMLHRRNRCPIVSLRPSVHHLWFTRRRCHLIKNLIVNLPLLESWSKGTTNWAVAQVKGIDVSIRRFLPYHTWLRDWDTYCKRIYSSSYNHWKWRRWRASVPSYTSPSIWRHSGWKLIFTFLLITTGLCALWGELLMSWRWRLRL